ncbi:MAG: adenylylsulfate reductase, partial [Bacillota bacterium]
LKKVKKLKSQIKYLAAENYHQLMSCQEIIDRIDVAEVLIHHLLYRKETRWPAYQSRTDYPDQDDKNWLKFVNSYQKENKIKMVEKPYQKII